MFPEPTHEQLLAANADLAGLVAEQRETIRVLTERVQELEARLGKNSQNSSRPPSSDVFAKPPPRSLRKRSGRPPGKQTGEAGFRLEPVEAPDVVLVHAPSHCSCCGLELQEAPVVGQRARQVFDLPRVALEVTEHRAQARRCTCGAVTSAPFPTQASAPTCYGPRVAAVGTYLLARQHLPVARAAEAMADCFGAPVSTGWLASLLPRAQQELAGFRHEVRDRLQAAPVAHFDETGARVGAKLAWVHVAADAGHTLYHLAPGRGKDAIDAGAVLPSFTGVAVHDGWSAYRRYDVAHALCNAHHLRELAGIGQTSGQDWPEELADLLVAMHKDAQTARAQGRTGLPARQLARHRSRYRALLAQGKALNPPPPRTGRRGRPKLGPAPALLKRLDDFSEDVLRFATDLTVPFDNNQAERDVRMIKLQQKISGGWRSDTGAEAFLTVRSYLSTAAKHGQHALDVLTDIFTGHTWIPAPTTTTP